MWHGNLLTRNLLCKSTLAQHNFHELRENVISKVFKRSVPKMKVVSSAVINKYYFVGVLQTWDFMYFLICKKMLFAALCPTGFWSLISGHPLLWWLHTKAHLPCGGKYRVRCVPQNSTFFSQLTNMWSRIRACLPR